MNENLVESINWFDVLSGRYSWNIEGFAYLFADTYKDVSRYVLENNKWYCFNGEVWVCDADNLIVNAQARFIYCHIAEYSGIKDGIYKGYVNVMDDEIKYLCFIKKMSKISNRQEAVRFASNIYPVSSKSELGLISEYNSSLLVDNGLRALKKELNIRKLDSMIKKYPYILTEEFYKVQYKDGIPVINGFSYKRSFYVYCHGCGMWHSHGYPDESFYEEHRAAHCRKEESYSAIDYYIRDYEEHLRRNSL